MSTKLIPFSFETVPVRVVMMDGQPLFSARDVAVALGYANPSKAYNDHCKSLKKLSYNESLELGWINPNPQGECVIYQSDVLRLIIKSSKPEAEKFEKWVFEEVLPSVLETGSYTYLQAKPDRSNVATKYRQAQAIASSYMSVAKLFGADAPMARAMAAEVVIRETGVDFQPLLIGNVIEDSPLTPTELGKLINMSARKVNALLAMQGFQEKYVDDGDWVPTEKGRAYCTCNSYQSPYSEHTGYRTLWYRSVLDELNLEKEAA